MAIINNSGGYISYECTQLIEDIREDMASIRKSKKIYAACKLYQGVKIVFDYALDNAEKKEMKKQLSDDEWIEEATLRSLLSYAIRQNNPMNSYDSFQDLYDAAGMTFKEFSEFTLAPERTIQDWYYGVYKITQYDLKLIEYKLINENII